jgi:hypothetical protein
MKSTRRKRSRILLAVAIGVSLVVWLTAAARAETLVSAPTHNHAEHGQQLMKDGLEKMAARLEIKASQQDAWQAYSKAVEALTPNAPALPDANATATAMARWRADRVALLARQLAQLADATAKLQDGLTPEQSKTLDQIVRQFQHGRQMKQQMQEGDKH